MFAADPPLLNPLSAALVTQNGMFVSWLGSGKLIT
jgi:hypothetical protein